MSFFHNLSEEENPFGIERRRCTKKDYEFVFGLVSKVLWPYIAEYARPTKKKFNEKFKRNMRDIVILTINERKIGYYQLKEVEESLHIVKLIISPEFQGRGIGRYYMDKFEELARKKGLKNISLNTWENNIAVELYRSWGYKIKEKKDHRYFMEKIL